uniref:Outer dense fiber protein 1 n=2 Tax=Passerellidae TaxID=1729112 RepID=A0A8D2MYD9_ZONAL
MEADGQYHWWEFWAGTLKQHCVQNCMQVVLPKAHGGSAAQPLHICPAAVSIPGLSLLPCPSPACPCCHVHPRSTSCFNSRTKRLGMMLNSCSGQNLALIDVKGFDPKDITVTVKDGKVTVSAERKMECNTPLAKTSNYKRFVKEFCLPPGVCDKEVTYSVESKCLPPPKCCPPPNWWLSPVGTLTPKGPSHQLDQCVSVHPRGPQCQKHPLTAAAGNIPLETLTPEENKASGLCTACKQTGSLSQLTFTS